MLSDVDDHVRQMSEASRAAYAKGQPRKRLVERLARTELLALAASDRGLEKDPEVQRIFKQALVNALLRREIDDKLGPSDVPPVAVSKYLKQHPEEVTRPDQVRVGLIVIEDRATAERVAAQARALENGHGFAKLVAQHSKDAPSRARGGDLPFFAADSARHPKEIVEAAFTLKEPGDVAGPVKTAEGFAIVRLLEKRPGYQRTVEQARAVVAKRLREQLRAERVEKLVQQLQKKYPVKIEEKNVLQR